MTVRYYIYEGQILKGGFLMNPNKKKICNYLESIYLPEYFISLTDKFNVVCNTENIMKIVSHEFSCDTLSVFINSNKELFENIVLNQFLKQILKPIYFTVEELKSIQESDDPFTFEEIRNIFQDELDKENHEEINSDVIDYCLALLQKE